MDFDANITRLQGCLISLNNKGLLNQSGSEEAINVLKSIFKGLSDEQKAKMVFFLLLNTELEVSEQLKDDLNIGLFVDICPRLNKSYLIEILFELNLDAHLSQIIYNCPNIIVIEILNVLIERLKDSTFHKKHFSQSYLHDIMKAIFAKIMKNPNDTDLSTHLKEIVSLSESVILTSLLLDFEEVIKFTAEHFWNFFKCLHFCLKLFTNCNFNWEDDPIFEISIKFDKVQESENSKEEPLNVMLSSCGKILKALTLDTWMTWSDCYSDNDPEKTLQQLIGETIYLICEVINSSKIPVTEDLKNCLASLKIKPETEDDVISKATVDEIILKINENVKSKEKWVKALVHSSNIITNEKAVECLLQNLSVVHTDDAKYLIDKCLEEMKNSGTIAECNKILLLSSIKNLTLEEQKSYLENIINSYDTRLLETPNCVMELTETFNKMSSGEKKIAVTELLGFCLQMPLKTISKICELAVNNPKEMENCLDNLDALKSACSTENFHLNEEKIENINLITFVLNNMMQDDLNSKEEQNFLKLITKLFDKNLISLKFLEKHVLESLRVELLNENWNKVVFTLEILKASLKVKSLEYDTAVLLAFMSQVLGHLSWDWNSFMIQKVEGRELAISIISHLLKGLENVNNHSQISWLRTEIMKAEKINQIYFCDLWLKYDKAFADSDELYIQLLILLNSKFKLQTYVDLITSNFEMKKSFEVRSSVIISLVKVLPVLTAKEWISLFAHLKSIISSNVSQIEGNDVSVHVLDFFITSLYILSLIMNRGRNSFSCFEFCVRNFGRLTQEIISSKKTLGPEAHFQILKGIIFFLKAIERQGERESCSVILSPIILTLVDSIKNNEGNMDNGNIVLWISLLNVNDIEKAVKNKLDGIEMKEVVS